MTSKRSAIAAVAAMALLSFPLAPIGATAREAVAAEESGEVRRRRAARRQSRGAAEGGRAARCRSPTSRTASRANYPRCARAMDTSPSAPTATISPACARSSRQRAHRWRRAFHGGVGQGAGRGAGRHGGNQRPQIPAAHAGHGARRHPVMSQGDRSLRADLARRESGATGTRNPHRRVVRQLRLRAGRVRARCAIHARRAGHRQRRSAA